MTFTHLNGGRLTAIATPEQSKRSPVYDGARARRPHGLDPARCDASPRGLCRPRVFGAPRGEASHCAVTDSEDGGAGDPVAQSAQPRDAWYAALSKYTAKRLCSSITR